MGILIGPLELELTSYVLSSASCQLNHALIRRGFFYFLSLGRTLIGLLRIGQNAQHRLTHETGGRCDRTHAGRARHSLRLGHLRARIAGCLGGTG